MAKPKKAPPPEVIFAQLMGDKGALSRLGRAGAMRRKELRELDKKRQFEAETLLTEMRIGKKLQELRSLAEQANEHICPVD